MSKEKLKNRGITLIALIITIIVMLILTAVTLNIALGENGIVNKAKLAKEQMQLEMDREILLSAVVGAIGLDGKVDLTKLDNNLPEGFSGTNGTYLAELSGTTFTVSLDGTITVAENETPGGGDIIEDGDGEVITNPWIARGLSADWEYGKWYVFVSSPTTQFLFLGADGSFMQNNGEAVLSSTDIDDVIAGGILTVNGNELESPGNWKCTLNADGTLTGEFGSDSDTRTMVVEEELEFDLEGTYLKDSGDFRLTFTLGSAEVIPEFKSADSWSNATYGITSYCKYKETYYLNGMVAEVSEDLNTITYDGTTYTKQAN